MNQSMNDKSDCRTAPAKLGMVIKELLTLSCQTKSHMTHDKEHVTNYILHVTHDTLQLFPNCHGFGVNMF